MVKIRLQRHGRKGDPVYRIVVADSRWKRDGKVIQVLGYYNPKREMDFRLDLKAYNDWIQKGAQPTARVKAIVKLQMKKEVQQ
ncbi:MAG: 30S ribosomal protein S16 [candidate division WOR-3 bacterium]|nr:30S ribosomal protein S16 [candidate division WOR-3 bacterium]MCX7948347.1 30S ribosomal protein S16 [candidate division WOR-3 bacterium]MDW8151248.1 30S ribosomal protein S16 [candidate division WOR-3 bacterium]